MKGLARAWRRRPLRALGIGIGAGRGWLGAVVGALSFVAALSLAGERTLSGQAARGAARLAAAMTVEIPPVPDAAERRRRLDAALAALAAQPGIAAAAPLAREEVAGLLAPWLGEIARDPALRLPDLVDVTLAPGARVESAAIQARLRAAVPDARLDDHRQAQEGLHALGRLAAAVAALVTALVAGAAAVAIAFATLAGLARQRSSIETLHLIGAEDRDIAREFARTAFWPAFAGAAAGAAGAGLSLIEVGRWVEHAAAPLLLPALALAPADLAPLLLLPPAAGLVTTATAWATVLVQLRRLP